MKIRSRFLILLFVAAAIGCSTAGVEITQRNNRIETSSYSLIIPPDRGWRLARDDARDSVTLTRQEGPVGWRMLFYKNALVGNQAASAGEIADDFRQLEIQVMTEEGVK